MAGTGGHIWFNDFVMYFDAWRSDDGTKNHVKLDYVVATLFVALLRS